MRKRLALGALAGGSVLCGAAAMAYGVRGRSSRWFGPSVYRGSSHSKAIALTFDDGPSEATTLLLDLLAEYRVPATFFQCGANVRRLSAVAREVRDAAHEIGNHSDTHPPLYFRSPRVITEQFQRAQVTFEETLGISPQLMRPPFGARWFGFRAMQRRLGLLGVMWTIIGKDWTLSAGAIARRILRSVSNGAIICLHDGRELQPRPDVRATLGALRELLPALADRGFEFHTVSQLLCRK